MSAASEHSNLRVALVLVAVAAALYLASVIIVVAKA